MNAIKVMKDIDGKELGLALIFIEHNRQECKFIRNGDINKVKEIQGFKQGILMAAKLLGVPNFYETISKLGNALEEG